MRIDINALFNDTDADVCSSFLCSYVIERGVGNSFIGRLLRPSYVTPYIRPFSNNSGHIDFIQTRQLEKKRALWDTRTQCKG